MTAFSHKTTRSRPCFKSRPSHRSRQRIRKLERKVDSSPGLAPIRSRAGLLSLACLLVACAAATWFAYAWSEKSGYAEISNVASHQLDLYSAGLDRELRRHEYLPSYLELDLDVIDLLRHTTDPERQRKVSQALGKISVRAGTISIFLLDRKGTVVAASNWQPESLVGIDYSKRPVYRDALKGGLVGYFSGIAESPEFYLAESIRANGVVMGVAVVKIGLEGLEAGWAASASHFKSTKFLVVDENDVVILASEPGWKFRTIAQQTPQRRQELLALEKYPSTPKSLELLGWDFRKTLAGGELVLGIKAPGGGAESSTPFVAHEKTMLAPPWRFITLSEASGVSRNARNTAAAACFASALLGLLGVFLWQGKKNAQSRLRAAEALQQAQFEMSLRVKEHNAELQQANAELRREVAERQRAETVLRDAQDGLVQAGKLALLGQMSAGITHEINQPLTALRALSANAKRLLEMARLDDVKQNLESIADLTERMGRLTAQLKTFARKAPSTIRAVQVSRAVANALLLMDSRIRGDGVTVHVDVPEGISASCDGNRVEQVLVNLFANALDAMRDMSDPGTLSVRAWADGGRVLVRVTDSGHGIPDHAMQHLFEPFFSTKQPGEGLGLGLMISAQIVREFGGQLRAFNTPDGAAFEFDLGLVEEVTHV